MLNNLNSERIMKPTEKQIALYKQIRQITEKHHAYSDQMMELAIWIDTEFEQKGKRTVQQQSDSNCNIPLVSNRRELLIAYNKHILDRLTEYEGDEICDNMVDEFIGNL